MEKPCKQCGQTKPLEAFYRDKRREDGRDFYCKECRDGRGAALRARRKESRPPRIPPTEKLCKVCGIVKPINEFYNGAKNRRSKCKVCTDAEHKAYISRPDVAAKIREYDRNRAAGKWKRPPRRQPIGPGYEVCTMCNEDKPLDQFHAHKLGRNGVNSICKECAAHRSRERRQDPTVKEREHRQQALRRHPWLSPGQYDELLEAQNGGCAICGRERADGNGRRLHVDHDHETLKVRGLLCYACNAGLGSFGDDPDLMFKAIEYLLAHKES